MGAGRGSARGEAKGCWAHPLFGAACRRPRVPHASQPQPCNAMCYVAPPPQQQRQDGEPVAEQKRAPVRDAASWLSEAARLDMSGAPSNDLLSALDAALAIDPLHASAHYNRGVTLAQLGAALEEQMACYNSALAVDPLHVTAHVNRGAVLELLGAAQEEELACYDSALAIDPLLALAHYNRGVKLKQIGAAPEERLACYDSALAIDPLYLAAHVNRGAALEHLKAAPEEQIACYESALAVNPLHAVAHHNRGVALQRIGAAHEEELACYNAALAIDPSYAKENRALAMAKLAVLQSLCDWPVWAGMTRTGKARRPMAHSAHLQGSDHPPCPRQVTHSPRPAVQKRMPEALESIRVQVASDEAPSVRPFQALRSALHSSPAPLHFGSCASAP